VSIAVTPMPRSVTFYREGTITSVRRCDRVWGRRSSRCSPDHLVTPVGNGNNLTSILRIDASARVVRSLTRDMTSLFVSEWHARESSSERDRSTTSASNIRNSRTHDMRDPSMTPTTTSANSSNTSTSTARRLLRLDHSRYEQAADLDGRGR
jgi:hypothetical protein